MPATQFDVLEQSAAPQAVRPRQTALYRFSDSGGALLYVGITFDLVRRLAWHRRHSAWWPYHARLDVSWLPDRGTAEQAELNAIRTEEPIHNVAGRAGPAIVRLPAMPSPHEPRLQQIAGALAQSRAKVEEGRRLLVEAIRAAYTSETNPLRKADILRETQDVCSRTHLDNILELTGATPPG